LSRKSSSQCELLIGGRIFANQLFVEDRAALSAPLFRELAEQSANNLNRQKLKGRKP
jgi:hypothetical protein